MGMPIQDAPARIADDNNSKIVDFNHESSKARNPSPKLSRQQLQQQRSKLPIFQSRAKLIELVQANHSLVVVGETGSGKTTQLPQYVLEAGLVPNGKMIAVTQPRRVAAITVAQRVANEIGSKLGDMVGYHIRFDDKTSQKTKLKFATDGILLQECIADPKLKRYSVVIIDEAHERTVHTDVLLALVKRAQTQRASTAQPLKVICMSATIESTKFSQFLGGCPIEVVRGRTFPVSIRYLREPEPDFVEAALIAILQTHVDHAVDGDILCFLTGQEEIESLHEQVVSRAKLLGPDRPVIVCPIYAALPQQQQLAVFEPTPPGVRKIILATNIAETSLTIDGVKYVIDCGLAKKKTFHSATGIESLVPSPIAKSEACQRAGRAGRQQAGFCYRLYTEDSYEGLADVATPEIRRCNLSAVVLQLKALGIDNILKFDFIDRPDTEALIQALMHLYELDALDKSGRLTPIGRKMSRLPLEPVFAKVLLASASFSCTSSILTIVAMLSTDAVFYQPKQSEREVADAARVRFSSGSGDHIMLLNVFNAAKEASFDSRWCSNNFVNFRSVQKALSIRKQLVAAIKQQNVNVTDDVDPDEARDLHERVRRCLCSGLFLNSAVLQPDGSYKTHNNNFVYLHPTSSLFSRRPRPAAVVFTEMVFTTKTYIRTVTEIEPVWLPDVAPKLGIKRSLGSEATEDRLR